MAAMSATYAAAQAGITGSPSTQSQRLDAALLLEVVDQSGAVITNAKVTLTDHTKKTLYEGKTDSRGQVLIPHLAPGGYSVVVAAINFSTSRLEADVHALQTQEVTIKMQVSALMGDIIEITGPVPQEPIRFPDILLPE